jgi:DNA-binding XRE family transcriptional regulator
VELLKDRSYYRTEEDKLLIEEAKYNPNVELAVALAERLEEVQFENAREIDELQERADDFERDANRLDDRVYVLQQQIEVLELMLATRDETIEQLKEQKND